MLQVKTFPIPDQADDIKPGRLVDIHFDQVMIGGIHHSAHSGFVHKTHRVSPLSRCPGLHLDKNNEFFVLCNNINLVAV